MALWVCRRCATAYAVGLAACPQCGSTDYRPDWEEDDVAKITTEGVSWDEGQEPPAGAASAPAAVEPEVAPDPPPVKAPKADWVEHAVAVGVAETPEEAEALTKAELVETVKAAEPPDPGPAEPATTPGPDSTPPPSSPESSAPADGDG